MSHLTKLAEDTKSLLGLEWPIRFSYSFCPLENYLAWHEPRRTKNNKPVHYIKMYIPSILNDTRTLQSIIVHELIHAWQAENNNWDESGVSHCVLFQNKAEEIEHLLKEKYAYDLGAKVYNRYADNH